MMGWYHGWGGWLGMSVTMIIVWGLVFAAILLIFRSDDTGRGDGTRAKGRPGRILAERYARGEIDEAEYRSRMNVLLKSRPRRVRRHSSTVNGG